MSIPVTVSRVLKYIPELQKHVVKMTKKKEQLLLKGYKWQEHNSSALKDRCIDSLVVTATCLADKEIMVNICILSKRANKTPLFKYLEILEGEGLKLINASTLSTPLEERIFYNLHFKVYTIHMILIYFVISIICPNSNFLSSFNLLFCNVSYNTELSFAFNLIFIIRDNSVLGKLLFRESLVF
jgi:hypothetical protein